MAWVSLARLEFERRALRADVEARWERRPPGPGSSSSSSSTSREFRLPATKGGRLAPPSFGILPGREARCCRHPQLERTVATRSTRWRSELEGRDHASRCARRSLRNSLVRRAAPLPARASNPDGIDARPLSRQARAVGPGAASVTSPRNRAPNSGCDGLRALGPKRASSGLGALDRQRPFWSPEAFLGRTKKALWARRQARKYSRESTAILIRT